MACLNTQLNDIIDGGLYKMPGADLSPTFSELSILLARLARLRS
jgi:hypothetical protein